MKDEVSKSSQQGIAIPNAGLVILNSFFKMLFERLNIVENDTFKSTKDQLNAVQYLQYIAIGSTETKESQMVLNKVICGIAPTTPIKKGLAISEADKKLMDGLIQAVIEYWSAIGQTSISGFRGNWLVRDGFLKEEEDHWELTVEKRAYDILLNRSPFSFSIIKQPWMTKPIYVNWPY